MAKFKIGDRVWVARFTPNHEFKITCSVCYGKKVVTLILGNGDHVELPCDYCGKGFNSPTGVEEEYHALCEPEEVRITHVEINVSEKGEEVRYSGNPYVYRDDRVFSTREEALAKSEELRDAWILEQNTRAEHIKKEVKKTYAWNAGYHRREAKRLRERIAYHEDRAKLCKDRSKEATE